MSPEPAFGLAYLLEDKTGRLSGSDFVDLYERMRLAWEQRDRDSDDTPGRYVYDIFEYTVGTYEDFHEPMATLTFGEDHGLGTILYPHPENAVMRMERYLAKVNEEAGPRLRRFYGSDGKEYRWAWRADSDDEWTCTDSDLTMVAHYSLKPPEEPVYYQSSGAIFMVHEDYAHLAVELLATCMIMRHIVAYNLS